MPISLSLVLAQVGNLSKKDMARQGVEVVDVDTEATVSDEEYEGKGKGRRAPKTRKVGKPVCSALLPAISSTRKPFALNQCAGDGRGAW